MLSVSSSCCGSMYNLIQITTKEPYGSFNLPTISGYAPLSITNEKISSLNKNLVFNKSNDIKTYHHRLQNTRVSSPDKHRTRSPSISNNDRSS